MFESELKKSGTSQQPTLSSLSSEFVAFREFVMATLKTLEQQVAVLTADCDNIEMSSRRAMLLLHGVPEAKDETPVQTVVKVASQHLVALMIVGTDISRATRLGKARADKPRPLLIKFQSETVRDNAWLAKTNLKGTGITMSEFLTKRRHSVFVAARERFGVKNCWTSAGRIVAVDGDGKRHRISSLADIDRLASSNACPSSAMTLAASQVEPGPTKRRAASTKRK